MFSFNTVYNEFCGNITAVCLLYYGCFCVSFWQVSAGDHCNSSKIKWDLFLYSSANFLTIIFIVMGQTTCDCCFVCTYNSQCFNCSSLGYLKQLNNVKEASNNNNNYYYYYCTLKSNSKCTLIFVHHFLFDTVLFYSQN